MIWNLSLTKTCKLINFEIVYSYVELFINLTQVSFSKFVYETILLKGMIFLYAKTEVTILNKAYNNQSFLWNFICAKQIKEKPTVTNMKYLCYHQIQLADYPKWKSSKVRLFPKLCHKERYMMFLWYIQRSYLKN